MNVLNSWSINDRRGGMYKRLTRLAARSLPIYLVSKGNRIYVVTSYTDVTLSDIDAFNSFINN